MISRYRITLVLILALFSYLELSYSSNTWQESPVENPSTTEKKPSKETEAIVPPSAPRRSNSTPPRIIDRTAASPSTSVPIIGKGSILPEGTVIEVRLAEEVSTKNHQTDDQFETILDRELILSNKTRIPKGTRIKGRIVEAVKPGRVKGKAEMSIVLASIRIAETDYNLHSNEISFEAESTKGSDAKAVGISTAIGAAIGAIFGGKKGATAGAAGGAGAGTAGVLLSRGRDIELDKERLLSFRLEEELRIVPTNGNP